MKKGYYKNIFQHRNLIMAMGWSSRFPPYQNRRKLNRVIKEWARIIKKNVSFFDTTYTKRGTLDDMLNSGWELTPKTKV